MPFALKIANDGGPVKVDVIEGECLTRMIVSTDPAAKAPTTATMRIGLTDRSQPGLVTLDEGQTLVLRGNKEVWGVVGWELDDSAPLLGFFEARFTLKRHGVDIFTTPAYAFVMQSEPGVLDAVAAEAIEDSDDARGLLRVIDGMEGTPSACVKELRAILEAAFPPAA